MIEVERRSAQNVHQQSAEERYANDTPSLKHTGGSCLDLDATSEQVNVSLCRRGF
jgi:hypothetical protein